MSFRIPGILRRASNQSIKFLLVLKAENIRSGLLDEFSSREACSSSAFSSSKVGTYCSQEELLLRICGHGDVFVIIKKILGRQLHPLPSALLFSTPPYYISLQYRWMFCLGFCSLDCSFDVGVVVFLFSGPLYQERYKLSFCLLTRQNEPYLPHIRSIHISIFL